jgi:hypothetical protein
MAFSALTRKRFFCTSVFTALTGILFFSGSHSVLTAHASVYVSSTQALYHFAASTSTADSSANAWNLDGSATPNTTSSFVSTDLHEAFDDTSHQNVYTSAAPNFNTNFSAFSLFGWIYMTSSSVRIFSNASQDSIVLYISGGKLACQIYVQGSGAYSVSGGTTLNNNQKYHVGCVWDGSKVHLYVNGAEDATAVTTATGSLRSGTSALYVGEGAGDTEKFIGKIDELLLTNNAIVNTSTISSLYASGNGAEVCTTVGCDSTSSTPVPRIATSTLHQYESNGTTDIGEGSSTTQSKVVFAGELDSSSTNLLQLQVEVEPSSTSFTNIATATSTTVTSGNVATTSASNLANGAYHWQARAVDTVSNASSSWTAFGGTTDFVVSVPNTPGYEISDGSVQALYHFNTPIPASDTTSNGYDLTGSATPNTTSSFVSTDLHDAFDDTTHQNVYTSATPNFNANFSKLSVFAWIYMTGSSVRIFSDASQDSIVLYISGGKLACQVYVQGSGAYSVSGSTTLNQNTNYHVGCVWDGSKVHLYVNGAEDATAVTTATGSLRNGTSALYIGEGAGDTEKFIGKIDELVVTNSALSTTTITALYNGGSGQEVCIVQGCGNALALNTLEQKQTDASTTIGIGSITTENKVVFAASMQVASGTAELQVEEQLAGVNFTGTSTAASAVYVASGTVATTTIQFDANRSYHWQARAVDTQGNASPWQQYETSTNPIDFRVSSLSNAASVQFSATSSDALAYLATPSQFTAADSSTIEFWYRTSEPTSSIVNFIDTRSTSTHAGYLIKRYQDQGIEFYLACASGTMDFRAAASSANLNGTSYDVGGIWHQVAITKSASTDINAFNLYFDGIAQSKDLILASSTISGNCYDASSTNKIWFGIDGSSSSSTDYWTGNMDEVRIWKSERSSSTIGLFWNQEIGYSTTNLVDLWHFNGTSTDFLGNATSGQNGTPSFASSTPFGHFIYGYNHGLSIPISIANSSTRKLSWYYASSTYSDALNYASAQWNTLGRVTLASTTATSSAAGMDLEILEENSSTGMWFQVPARTFYTATSSYPAGSLVLNYPYLHFPICDPLPLVYTCSDYQRETIMHEFGHALGLDHSYWGNIMNYAPPDYPSSLQTYLGDQDISDYRFIWGN